MQAAASVSTSIRWRPGAWLGRPRLLIAVTATGVIAAAMTWQWSWLVAVGAAPLLISAAPCAAMCGLGLCMHRMSGHSCSAANAEPPNVQADPGSMEIVPDRNLNKGDVT